MNPTATQTKIISINGKNYAIETTTDRDGSSMRYILNGKRGAKYTTVRNKTHQHLMFLVQMRGFGIPAGFENVWLSDKNGSLEVANVALVR